jgi:hypothetical protein
MNGRRAYLLIALLAATGCVSYPRVTPEGVTPRSELSFRFDAPREVTFRNESGESGDTLLLANVVEVRGRMAAVTADSIVIRAVRAEFDDGPGHPLGTGTIATFALTDVGMREVDTHPGRTALLIAAIGLGLALAIAVATYEEPPPPPPKECVKCG